MGDMSEARFTQLAEQYMDMVYRIALNCLGNRADAEDAAQNVMIRLYRRAPVFESEDHAKRWLCRVAMNEAKRLAASPWRHRTAVLEEALLKSVEQEPDRAVLEAVWQLPEKYRLPLYLHYFEGYPLAQVAEILGRKESTVQTQLARARDRLRELLKEG